MLSDAVRRCQTLSAPHTYTENALRVLCTAQAWHGPSTEHHLNKSLLALKWLYCPVASCALRAHVNPPRGQFEGARRFNYYYNIRTRHVALVWRWSAESGFLGGACRPRSPPSASGQPPTSFCLAPLARQHAHRRRCMFRAHTWHAPKVITAVNHARHALS